MCVYPGHSRLATSGQFLVCDLCFLSGRPPLRFSSLRFALPCLTVSASLPSAAPRFSFVSPSVLFVAEGHSSLAISGVRPCFLSLALFCFASLCFALFRFASPALSHLASLCCCFLSLWVASPPRALLRLPLLRPASFSLRCACAIF